MSKRILSLVLTLTLVLGSFSMAFADTADNTSLTTEQKIEYLKQNGFIKGNESGDDMLDVEIDRASVATIIARTLLSGTDGDVETEIAKSNYVGPFKDVPQSHWGNAAINVAVENQITNGTGKGEFSPARNITYIEVIAMMNRILGNEVEAGIDWNVAKSRNIALAREAGILDGINMNDFNYDDVAIRGVIFELLYNTVTNFEVGQYQIDKVIVLENNRVESIGENELVVEVIEEVQRANFIDTNDERRGEQKRISIPSDVEIDTEDMLGKVIDLSYDATNKAVRAQLDKTYEYKSGDLVLESKKVTVDGDSYTVLKEDRYKENDERIFSTYVNNEDFSYDDARKDFKTLDFGKITIKNGKVLFIDGFAFDDIAPVKSVKENGKKTELTVHNDLNDGGTKRIELEDEKVVSFENGSFKAMNKEDIAELDVVHVGEDSKGNKAVVVRTDAQVNGTYEKVVEYKNETVVVIDEEEYEILTSDAKKPVYAYDSKEFKTLHAKEAATVLKEFKNEKSTALLDVNGNLQYLGSEIEFGEFVGLVERIVGKEARILDKNDTKDDYAATLDSTFGDKSTGHQSLQSYDKGDLVFVAADKDEIDTMKLFSKFTEASERVTAIDKDLKNITIGGETYRTFDRTNVFVRTLKDSVDKNGNTIKVVDKMYATNLETIEKSFKDSVGSEAIVKTDADYNKLDPRRDFDKGSKASEGIANTIIFTEDFKADLDREIVEIDSVSNRFETVTVKFEDGTKVTYNVEKDSDAYDLLSGDVKAGDIVELGITKNDDKIVKEIELLVSRRAEGFKITDYNQRSKVITLSDGNTYYLTKDTADFVKGGIEIGKFVAVDGDKYVRAIATRNPVDAIKEGQITKINVAENLILVDGEVLLLDNKVKLIDENKKALAIGKDQVVNYLKKDNVVKDIVRTQEEGLVVELTLVDAANVVDSVKAAITNLPSVATMSLDDEVAVVSARNAYNRLSDADKANVTNYDVLVAAETKIEELKAEAGVLTAEAKVRSFAGRTAVGVSLNNNDRLSEIEVVTVNGENGEQIITDFQLTDGDVRFALDHEKAITSVKVELNDGTIIEANIVK